MVHLDEFDDTPPGLFKGLMLGIDENTTVQ